MSKPIRSVVGLCLLLGTGVWACSKAEPYLPPDPFYYFASYPVGKNPTTITTGDFNHDSLTDLITTNISSNTVSILLGNGDGSFKEQTQLHVCQEPRSLAMNDFNEDGHADVVLACSGGDEVALLLGRGNGKFEEGARYPVHRSPVSLAAEDVNGDHHVDLAVALRNDKVKVFLGNGRGELRHGVQYEHGDTPTSVALSDLNGDGRFDLVVTNGGPMSNAVSVWLGNGDGTFRDPKDYSTGRRPLGVSFGDFNNDHNSDLLVINGEKDSFTTFLGNGNATFRPGKDAGADAGPNFGLARDFNGDQLVDVAIVNLQSNDLSILFGKGDGTFHYPPRNYRTKSGPFALSSFRVTTTGGEEPGLAIADNGSGSVSIFLHRGLKSLARSDAKG
ncbi:MAG: VCBS repeat-containing protein [Nitrospira sp.]|nr:VCBS repeat-containing protein [Nitrospira sp.]MDH4304179.1 VCBS repeat-containing protein [Nitrospira sp.]MDH5194847.1 VCBS repeat-containing protein [Nitrospira sp.]